MKSIYLFPGKIAASKEPAEITTILGSCVAVAIFDTKNKIGGLNHFLLATPHSIEAPSPRYGSFAIPALIEELQSLGGDLKNFQAKVYGGGNVLAALSVGTTVGKNNIECALSTLEKLKIPIVEKNVGGEKSRHIILNTSTFEVAHKHPGDNTEVSGFEKVEVAKNIKVLIVDDSATIRTLFNNTFTKSGLQVCGLASNALEARNLIVKHKPDVLTLDIEMPNMNGVDFLEKLMEHLPTPVVMVSSLSANGDAAMRALDLGAIEFVHKPSQFDPEVIKKLSLVLVDKVRAAASSGFTKNRVKSTTVSLSSVSDTNKTVKKSRADLKAIVVGGNTGSQNTLITLLTNLAEDTPPVIVADSTISIFLDSFIEKIKKKTKLTLRVAKHGEQLRLGTVYFAPPEHQTRISKNNFGLVLDVKPDKPCYNQLPSASVLFESCALNVGAGCIGILLSGFGNDGVDGISKIQDIGGFTIIENPEDASFPYAPQQAINIGCADQILSAKDMHTVVMDHRNRSVA